jgi:hypothetical protein
MTEARYIMSFKTMTDAAANPLGELPDSIAMTEEVYAIAGTTPNLDPDLGTIQTWQLTAASTPVDTLTTGQSMTLMIDDGDAYSITWPTMTWVGGSAPSLATSGYTVVSIWKVGTTLYGAHIGDVA